MKTFLKILLLALASSAAALAQVTIPWEQIRTTGSKTFTGSLTAGGTLADQGGSIAAQRSALGTAQTLDYAGTVGASIANVPAFGTGDFTVLAVVSPTALPSTNAAIVGDALGNGFQLGLLANGTLMARRSADANVSSASSGTLAANASAVVAYSRSGTAGKYYVNGVASGTAVDSFNYSSAITRIGNSIEDLFWSGSLRLVGIFNRALSAAEQLQVYQTGTLSSSDIGAAGAPAGTTVTAGSFVVAKKYRIATVGSTTFTSIGASANTVGVEFTATGVGSGTGTAVAIGALFAPDPAQFAIDYQWSDTSGLKSDITIPASGVVPKFTSNAGSRQVRATLTWAGTHEAKSLLGQVALPARAQITSIVTLASAGSSGSGLTVGSVTTPALFVAANAYTTTRKVHTLAAAVPAGTATNDLSLVLDPDTANYTGTIQVWINYTVTN